MCVMAPRRIMTSNFQLNSTFFSLTPLSQEMIWFVLGTLVSSAYGSLGKRNAFQILRDSYHKGMDKS